MLFDDAFIDGITDSPVDSVVAICERVIRNLDDEPEYTAKDYDNLLEGYALLQAVKQAGVFPETITDEPDELQGDPSSDCAPLSHYFHRLRDELRALQKRSHLQELTARFARDLKVGFSYEFSAADLQRVQTLINELRNEVSTSTFFEPDHQARLLKRLEQLQREVHKRVSDLDRFWGLLGDAGVALGRFGENAKPFVDRISELTQIVWNTQKQTEGLPSNTSMPPLLPNSEQSDRDES